jgi:hypothetical protein
VWLIGFNPLKTIMTKMFESCRDVIRLKTRTAWVGNNDAMKNYLFLEEEEREKGSSIEGIP